MPSKKEIVDYYEKEYAMLYPSLHAEHTKFKASEILSILQKLKLKKPLNILELGCGSGGVSKELGKAIKHHFFVGVDVSSSILRVAKKVNKNLLLVKADCEETPIKDKSFELVLLIDVLEHLKCPWKLIAESVRISKRWVIIRTPIEDCLYYRLRMSEETCVCRWKKCYGHVWRFNLPFLKKVLQENGLILVEVHISKCRVKSIREMSLDNIMRVILTRLIPSATYRKLFPSEHLILAIVKA